MFTGLSAFPLTPIPGNGSVDEKAFATLVGRLATARVDSIGALGSTGSYAYLTLEERARVARIAVKHADGVPVIVGIGALRTRQVLQAAEDAQNAGAAGVLLAPVSYQPLTDDDVFGLFEEVTANLSIPLVIYDNPGTTHFTFTDELYTRLAWLPKVASIKIPALPDDPEQARARVAHLRQLLPNTVTVGISGDAAAARGLNAGCDAWYSVIGGTFPQSALAFTGGSSRAAASEELRACLLQELVLRGVTVAESPAIEAWATSSHWGYHPLAWLPLELSVIEETPPLPSYSVGGASYSIPYGPQDGPGVALGSVTPLPQVTETTTEEFSQAATAAVANWAEESNGRSEAGMYELAEPVEAEILPGLLAALGLECLSGVGPRTPFALSACRPEHAWRMLFAAASTGGAYNNGVYGAYGRLAAWRSLAALSGASTAAPVGEVERNIQECDWYSFGAATKWFERVAWDIGLVSVTPRARRIAVLAATDTD
ncbi:DUF6183 family protein [Streptomyces werraensis]|uniref:DUF6183 family protein n=1 Tax=Streptomyces werraensis TaxID=68284 RepID=UPI0036FA937F